MNSKLLVIKSSKISDDFNNYIETCLVDIPYEIYDYKIECKNRKILFVAELNKIGYDLELLAWLTFVSGERDFFENSIAGIIIKSSSDLYTKTMAQDIILHTNSMGLSFIGHSVIEMTKGYANFKTWQKTMDKSLIEIAEINCTLLAKRIYDYKEKNKASKKVLALHSSSYKTSNTLGLWHLVSKKLKCKDINEIHIENGTVVDCKGCSFQTCIHYGKQHSCFYGGIMVEEVLPAIEESDVIVWICPNYNDSVSSNMLAVINRLTVLYRQISFHDKTFFAVIVSGSSGSDALAKQLIGALNINKGFHLPPYFALMETANDPLYVLKLAGIEEKSEKMAENLNQRC